MYLPEGKVMPAYSTWQPIEGKIQPVASADQSATRRLVDPRGDLIRGKTIASTLLGVSGVSPSFSREPDRRRESIPGPARPEPARLRPSVELTRIRNYGQQFTLPYSGCA